MPAELGVLNEFLKVTDYRDLIKEEYYQRRRRNHRYSMRAFARHLGISVGRLSEIFNGKQHLSSGRASEVARRCEWDPSKIEYFCALVESVSSRSPAVRELATKHLESIRTRASEPGNPESATSAKSGSSVSSKTEH